MAQHLHEVCVNVSDQIIGVHSYLRSLGTQGMWMNTENGFPVSQGFQSLCMVFSSSNSYIPIYTAEPVPLALCLPLRTVFWTVCQPSTVVSDL